MEVIYMVNTTEMPFNFRKNIGERKVGLEEEVIIVKASSLLAPAPNETHRFLKDFGWEFGMNPSDNGTSWFSDGFGIKTDMGSGTLELNFTPQISLLEVEIDLRKRLSQVIKVAEEHSMILIGLSAQPFSTPSWDIVMPKKRYKVLGNWHNTENFMGSGFPLSLFGNANGNANIPDTTLNSITAAHQIHVDVTRSEATDMVNFFNATSGEQIALNGNSTILGGHVSQFNEFRELAWDFVTSRHEDKGRSGVPDIFFRSVPDWTEFVCGFRQLLTKRGDEFLTFVGGSSKPKSFAKFVSNGANAVSLSDGSIKKIQFEPIDWFIHSSMVWPPARIQPALGTVEIRPIGQQPDINSNIATTAFVVGLVENLEEAKLVVDHRSPEFAKLLRQSAIFNGLRTDGVKETLSDLLRVSRKGLEMKGEPTSLLNPLLRRVETSNPADETRRSVKIHGVGETVRRSEINSE